MQRSRISRIIATVTFLFLVIAARLTWLQGVEWRVHYERAGGISPDLRSFRHWNRATQRDRSFILRVPWERLGRIQINKAAGDALGTQLAV